MKILAKILFVSIIFVPIVSIANAAGPLTVTIAPGQDSLSRIFSSIDGWGDIIDFGDGQQTTLPSCAGGCSGSAATAPHTYTIAGSYTASLISPATCVWSTTTQTTCTQVPPQTLSSVVLVVGESPALSTNLTVSPSSGAAPLAVTFSGNTDGRTYFGGYNIDYGDGSKYAYCGNSNRTVSCPSHTYTAPGTYTATLAGTGESSGGSIFGTAVIIVASQPALSPLPLPILCPVGQHSNATQCIYDVVTPTPPIPTPNPIYYTPTPTYPTPVYDAPSYYNNPSTVSPTPASYTRPSVTIQTSCSLSSFTLTRGMRDKTANGPVAQLQLYLANYFNVNQNALATGYFGPLTQSYVRKFQAQHGISTTGAVGPLTRAAMKANCSQ